MKSTTKSTKLEAHPCATARPGRSMKVTVPTDLDGRQFACIDRAKLIAETLYAFAHGATDFGPMSEEAMRALSQVADEMADELQAIRDCHVEDVNRRHSEARR